MWKTLELLECWCLSCSNDSLYSLKSTVHFGLSIVLNIWQSIKKVILTYFFFNNISESTTNKNSRGKLYQTEIDQDIRQRSRTRIAAKVKIATSILTTWQLDGNQPHPIGKTNECVYFNYMISSLYLNLELPLSVSTCISLLCHQFSYRWPLL